MSRYETVRPEVIEEGKKCYSEIIDEIKVKIYEARSRVRYSRTEDLILLIPKDDLMTIVRTNSQIMSISADKPGATIFGVKVKGYDIDQMYIALDTNYK